MTQEIGESVWNSLNRRKPSVFDPRWWDEKLLRQSMSDEAVKVQMFRFIDVLPMLRSYKSVNQHLHEYAEEVREQLPWATNLALDMTDSEGVLGRTLAYSARANARRMAKRFIAGTTAGEILTSVQKIRDEGFAFTLDLLGEAVINEKEAEKYQNAYLNLIRVLAPIINDIPESAQVDCDNTGSIPRMNVSLKLSALDSHFDPIDPEGTSNRVKERLRLILKLALENDVFVNIDMEHYAYKNLTLKIFKEIMNEKAFRDCSNVGIVVQAYLKDSEADLVDLLKWVKKRKTPISVRLVKGAYWDYETVIARSKGWDIPVFLSKWQSDENFEKLTQYLMDNYEWLHPAIASHNLRSLSHAVAYAKLKQLPEDAFELQMLYGMAREQAQVFSEQGYRVRIYTPFGELIPGMSYLVRRLLENTSNDSFLKQSIENELTREELMANPTITGETAPEPVEPTTPEFINEPLTDFSIDENRDAMEAALAQVQDDFGNDYPLIINGKAEESRNSIATYSPSDNSILLGRISSASADQATEAIETSRRLQPSWSKVEPHYRAEYLNLIADHMQAQRFELAAWEVYECAKPWKEADADIAEAIDFCRYYAQKMEELSEPVRTDVPGEENSYSYRPRGVAVVIAPWNFPLAILTGMTAAALVTGNTVIMKPAEQASIVGAKLMEIIQKVGIPDGVVQFLPGIGEEVGPELTGSPEVDVIAFTGSREVGLEIQRTASDTDARQTSIKKVIAELGGKNAIIIDDDADLDEAVQGVVYSAFGFSGQKCSACSRAIVLEDIYDQFMERLQGAVEDLTVGPAENPGTDVGPVIDQQSRERIEEILESTIENEEAEMFINVDVSELQEKGSYIGPKVLVDAEEDAAILREELFGPVLNVIKVKSFDDALKVANDTEYALTGGVYSRSPKNLKQAKQEFQVGNLYLNRPCTGALVHRQPFGGYKLSGIGSKAGGPEYLQQFLVPINVTENTMRRGFTPELKATAKKSTAKKEPAAKKTTAKKATKKVAKKTTKKKKS